MKRRLGEERKKHEFIVNMLKKEIFRLQELSESQQDQLLELEEGTTHLTAELTEGHYLVESERKSHEVEVNILSRKVENTEKAAMRLEYSLKQVMKEKARSDEDHEKKNALIEKKAQAELSELKSKLQQVTDSLSDQSSLHSAEMLQLNELLKREREEHATLEGVAELVEKHADEMEEIKYKLRVTVEELHGQLNAKEQYADDLKQELEAREREEKSLSSKLDILYKKEADYKDQIAAFEVSDDKYKADVIKLENQMSQMKSNYRSKILTLSAEFNKNVESEIDTLQSLLEETVSICEDKVNELSKELSVLVSSLRDSDLSHANTVKSLLFDLDQSKRDINTLKEETDRVHSELKVSRDELVKLNESRDVALAVSGDDVSSRNIVVDADSGQVIISQEDMQRRDDMILEKEEMIHSLRWDLDTLKHRETDAKALCEKANQKLSEQEREIWQAREETKTLQRKMSILETKLKQLQNEVSTKI